MDRVRELTLDGDLPSLADDDLVEEIAARREQVLAAVEAVSTSLDRFAAALTERIARRLLADAPDAATLSCRPVEADLRPGDLVLPDWPPAPGMAGRGIVLTVDQLVDADGQQLPSPGPDSPVHHWLRLVTPMVGAEQALLRLDTRTWEFPAP